MAANDLSAGEISSPTPPNTPQSSGGVSTTNPALQVWRPERKSRSLLRSFGSCFRPDDASSQPVDVGQLAVVSPARPSHSRSPSRGSTRISTPHVASPSVVTTGAPKHQDLVWQKALDSLTEEDRVALNFQSAEKLTLIKELTEIIEQKRELYIQKRWKFNYKDRDIVLRDVADKLLSWIDKFKQIGDTIVQYDPVHAALPWAGFRFLLQVIGGESEAMASILVASETIAKILDRCAIYERLYLVPGSQAPETRMMENALIELYASILRFLAQAKRFYEKNTAARITTSIFDVNGIKPLLDAIETSELEVCKIAGQAEACYQRSTDQKFIDQVTKLKNALDHLAEPIIRIDHAVEALRKALEEKRKDEILKWLSSVPYKQHHNTARKGRLEDSGQWFLTKDDFKNWQESSSSTLLWLHGIPGAGKTKLTSLVIDITADRLKSQNSGEGFAYFYCKRDEEERRNPDSIFGAILKQLVLKPNFYSMHKFVTSEYETNKADGFASGKLALEGSKQLIIQLLNIYPQTTIIIDALDECSPEKRETVLDALQELIHLPNNLVKIFLSSRKDNDIYQLFKRVPNISIEATDNANDIQRFIHESIDDRIARKKLLGGKVDKELQDQICTKLLEGAKGMFLWVDLQIHMLCGLKLDSEVKKKLGTLPDGLDKTYDAIFSEMIDCESADSKRLAYVSMMWIMCSRRQLSPDELVRAAVESLVVSNGPPEPRFVNIDTILTLCHNLVVVDVQLNVMRFSHLSVREFLEEYMWDTTVVNSMAAEVCMSLLIRGLSISLRGKPNPRTSSPYLQITGDFTLYPAYYWHYHLQDCGTGSQSLRIRNLVKRFLGTFDSPGLGFLNWLNISDYFSIGIGAGRTAMKLACFKYTPPDILPAVCYFGFGEILGDYWSSGRPLNRGVGHCSGWELLELAITEGHEYIINALLGRVVIAKRDFSRVLDIAISAGRGRPVEQLLHSAKFTSPTDSQLFILFRKAVAKRNNEIVKVLVSFMKEKTKSYKKLSTLGSDIAALIAWGGFP